MKTINEILGTLAKSDTNTTPCYIKITSDLNGAQYAYDTAGNKLEFGCNEHMLTTEFPGNEVVYSFVRKNP